MDELTIDREFDAVCDPPLPQELELLEKQLLADGCLDPIITWAGHDGTIIDGKHRYELCQKHSIPFKTKALRIGTREEVIAWIAAKQLGRRNVPDARRAMLAARLIVTAHGGDRKSEDSQGNSEENQVGKSQLDRESAAELAGVSVNRIDDASKVIKQGGAALQEAVRDGSIPLSTAATLAELPKSEQKKIAAKPETAKEAAKEIKAEKAGKKWKKHTDEFDTAKMAPKDAFNFVVPEYVKEAFNKQDRWQAAMSAISNAKRCLTELETHCSIARLDLAETERLLEQARTNLKFAMPYTECVKCRRKPKKECPHCKGTGWLNKATFTACASDPDKAWLEARK